MTLAVPNDVETYEFRHGDAEYFGTVEELAGGVMVRFNEDAPWKDNPMTGSFRADQVEYFRETSSNRERRHREGWESRGFENVARGGGPANWVPRAEAERARQALAMLESLDFPNETVPPALDPVAVDEAGAAAETPAGPLDYWPHAALVLVGLGLLGIVTRTLILPG